MLHTAGTWAIDPGCPRLVVAMGRTRSRRCNPQICRRVRQGVVGQSLDFDETPDMTVQDVAACVGLSYHAVLRAVHRGEVRAFKICGRIRLRRSDVRAWIEESRLAVEATTPPETPPPARGSLEALRALERRMQ